MLASATSMSYTLSLHDALPIFPPDDGDDAGAIARDLRHRRVVLRHLSSARGPASAAATDRAVCRGVRREDRKSTRLNSSHSQISYAVFCLKKKKHRFIDLRILL